MTFRSWTAISPTLEVECLDHFNSFWQEDEREQSARQSPAESHRDEGQQQQAVEEADNRLQPVELQQSHSYDSDAEAPRERIQYAIEWKALLKTKNTVRLSATPSI